MFGSHRNSMLLPLADCSVQAGFPSPATEYGAKRIDLAEQLIRHPQSTFLLRVAGLSMINAGIDDGNLIVVDKAIRPRNGHVVVAIVDGEFTVKFLVQNGNGTRLRAANPAFPDIVPRDGQTIEVWGVVTSTVKQFLC